MQPMGTEPLSAAEPQSRLDLCGPTGSGAASTRATIASLPMEVQLGDVQRQAAAHAADRGLKRAFHCKRAALAVGDLPKVYGHGGAGLPQLLNVPDAEGLLARAEGMVDTSQVSLQRLPCCSTVRSAWRRAGSAWVQPPNPHDWHAQTADFTTILAAGTPPAQIAYGGIGAAALAGHRRRTTCDRRECTSASRGRHA